MTRPCTNADARKGNGLDDRRSKREAGNARWKPYAIYPHRSAILHRFLPLACRTLLVFLVALSASPTSQAAAQETPPAYDHPLFTGPAHTPPTPRFDQDHLRLALRFDETRRRVFGDATLRLTPLDTLADTLVLFAAGLAIDSVRFGALDSAKVDAPFRIGRADSVLIALDTLRARAAPFEVRLVYTAQPHRGLYFIQPTKTHPNQKRQVWTSNAPHEQRHWFPALEAPGDYLTSEVLVTVDAPLRVLSNGRRVEETPNADGTVTVRYIQDQLHPPSRIMLAAGDYEVVEETIRPPIGRPIALSYWVYPERMDDVTRTFGRTPAMMQFFADRLREPYPWTSYSQVVLRRLPVEQATYAGAAALSDRVLIDERAALDDDPDDGIARALAHQWFGAFVTARYWNDVWLNEGFASYLSTLFEEHHAGEDALALRMRTHADRYLAEARQYRRPLVWNRWDDPARMFDAHSAGKATWVLHMLRRRIGDTLFWKVLEQHLATYASKPVETADFQRVVRSVTGERFDDFFAQWVEAAGHPVLDVRYAYDAGERTLAVTVEQVQEGLLVPDAFRTALAIEVHALTEAFRFDVALEARRQTFRLPLPARPRFVLIDPDGDLLADVRVDQPARAWVGQLRYAPNPTGRLQAARALAAQADDPALLVGLRSALSEEPAAAVRKAIVETIARFAASSATQRALAESLEDEDAAVRAAVLDALGAFEKAPAVHALAFEAAQNDPSYRVQAAAVKTLARTASPAARDVVRSALITPSHRDVIRQAAFEALALLDVPPGDGLDLSLAYSEVNQPTTVRIAALRYIQTLAPGSRAALNRLIDLLDDDDVDVRRAAIDGLAALGSERAQVALRRRLDTEPQPLLRAALDQALRRTSPSNE